jgi:hypothetical protein
LLQHKISKKNNSILSEYKKSYSEWSVVKPSQEGTDGGAVEPDALTWNAPEKSTVRNQVF